MSFSALAVAASSSAIARSYPELYSYRRTLYFSLYMPLHIDTPRHEHVFLSPVVVPSRLCSFVRSNESDAIRDWKSRENLPLIRSLSHARKLIALRDQDNLGNFLNYIYSVVRCERIFLRLTVFLFFIFFFFLGSCIAAVLSDRALSLSSFVCGYFIRSLIFCTYSVTGSLAEQLLLTANSIYGRKGRMGWLPNIMQGNDVRLLTK